MYNNEFIKMYANSTTESELGEEKHVYVKSFFNKEDAMNFVIGHLEDTDQGEYLVDTRITFINYQWRASVMLTKRQLEMELTV